MDGGARGFGAAAADFREAVLGFLDVLAASRVSLVRPGVLFGVMVLGGRACSSVDGVLGTLTGGFIESVFLESCRLFFVDIGAGLDVGNVLSTFFEAGFDACGLAADTFSTFFDAVVDGGALFDGVEP